MDKQPTALEVAQDVRQQKQQLGDTRQNRTASQSSSSKAGSPSETDSTPPHPSKALSDHMESESMADDMSDIKNTTSANFELKGKNKVDLEQSEWHEVLCHVQEYLKAASAYADQQDEQEIQSVSPTINSSIFQSVENSQEDS